MNLIKAWEALEGAPSNEGYEARRLNNCEPHRIYAARDNRTGARCLVVRITLEQAAGVQIQSSAGLTVRRIETQNYTEFEIASDQNKFKEPFEIIATDLGRNICLASTERDGLIRLMNCVALWQKFFQRASSGLLSLERQQGLYGELKFLELLLANIEHHTALSAWTGPRDRPQDFELPTCAVEVKATASPHHQVIRINHERQLDITGFEKLFLLHWSVDRRSVGTGQTLPALVEAIKTSLRSDLIDSFESKLAEYGYMYAHGDNYDCKYTIRESNCYLVSNGFPCITERDLPSGVGNVTYQIDVAILERFKTNPETIWK